MNMCFKHSHFGIFGIFPTPNLNLLLSTAQRFKKFEFKNLHIIEESILLFIIKLFMNRDGAKDFVTLYHLKKCHLFQK